MQVSATIKSNIHQLQTAVETNGSTKEITIAPKATGLGSSVNGAELLLLSLATCFCNDIYREAEKRKISVSSVEVIVNAVFGAEGEPGSGFTYKTNIVADASAAEIDNLITETDKVAEIHNTLRKGIRITLA